MPHAVTRPNLYAPRSNRPMGAMNVIPFIDVLLVLLIMLILAIPAPVHITPVDLPGKLKDPVLPVLADNTIAIDTADRLFWNGAPVLPETLRVQVAAASALEQPPLLRFAPDAQARYDTAARTIALMKEEGAGSFAFIGNEQHRKF